MQKKTQTTTPKDAYLKALRFCAYQERCHQEVLEKLSELGVYGTDAELIISELIQENYLNEERFAKIFAGSKFRVKCWGRIKIRQELKMRKISEYCINEAMKEIEEGDYEKTLQKLIQLKSATLKKGNPLQRNYKLAAFVIGKGFEPELVWELIKKSNY